MLFLSVLGRRLLSHKVLFKIVTGFPISQKGLLAAQAVGHLPLFRRHRKMEVIFLCQFLHRPEHFLRVGSGVNADKAIALLHIVMFLIIFICRIRRLVGDIIEAAPGYTDPAGCPDQSGRWYWPVKNRQR